MASYKNRSENREASTVVSELPRACSVLGTRFSVLLLLLLSTAAAHARVHRTENWARDRYAEAERMREALNGRPPAERTRRDYQRVLNTYRSVYFGAPTSTKADPSAVAVAETLVEMGRRFDDDQILGEAIDQYKFLRKEYPGSKYRCDALFTIGEIYKDDLNDPGQARTVFAEFLHRYPHNRLAEDAHKAIAELDEQAKAEKKAESKKIADELAADKNAGSKDSPLKDTPLKDTKDTKNPQDSATKTADAHAENAADSGSSVRRLPRVTGIRHWSTPDYTRVAIDLESDVKFGSQRIADPDRIFFDLRDTKLASTLVGKSFDVDDGFLKKIRVAQFQPGRTRVVLEVANLSDYDAFLLPDPYRLIIDIHGKDAPAKEARGISGGQSKRAQEAPATVADVEVPPKASGDSASSSKSIGTGKNLQTQTKATVADDENDEDGEAEDDSAKSSSPSAVKHVATETKKDGAPVKVIVDNDDEPVHSARKSHGASQDKLPSRLTTDRSSSEPDVREARPTASGDRSLTRALGLKIGRIVIDPGHGGHDTGTIGPDGLKEKDLVLEVGRKLGKLLETRLGAEVVYTRKDDTFIPLETRTAIANQQRADLFVSIHANSSDDPEARGVETYYLNFTSSPDALEVAARENAVSEKSVYELQDLVKKIALKEKIDESREFAGDVQESLHDGLAAKSPEIRNRGVKKAPFIVLIGANMPSILAEISFVSNPTDEHRLQTSEYREKIAESLYRGIAKYVDGLSGVKMASKIDKTAVR
jgi:N-acetylmuramoyl-L-alanine amidase